jgi:BASS family bile acid:Na+ symporter
MKKINSYKVALGFAFLFLAISLVNIFTGNLANSGPFLIAFFLTLAIAVRGFQSFKGFDVLSAVFYLHRRLSV